MTALLLLLLTANQHFYKHIKGVTVSLTSPERITKKKKTSQLPNSLSNLIRCNKDPGNCSSRYQED